MLSLRFYILFFILLISSLGYSKPFDKEDDYFKTHHLKQIDIKGTISDIKKQIRARSNIVSFLINDEGKSIYVKMYTINWLKRVNQFDCNNGDLVHLIAKPFHYNDKANSLGSILIKTKASEFSCEKPEIDEKRDDQTN